MVHVPPSHKKGHMKKERMENVDRQQHVESMRRTVESTIKKAIARRKTNGQPFPMFTVDSEGNVTTAIPAAAVSKRESCTVMDQGEDFADDELLSQPLTELKGKRIGRSSRGRGRLTVRRETINRSACPYPQPQPQPQTTAVLTRASDDEPPAIPPRKQRKAFYIRDAQAVKNFLHSRLKGMQQLADKKIAKAWIKSICPKKQANFPYQNKKAGHDGKVFSQPPKVPGWWPEQKVCRFIEPDHIKRTERMDLCLHLLRLRPTPKELKAWNEDKTEPHATHMYEGWTAFLKESAGAEIFDDLPKEDKTRTEHRVNLMDQMYRVANMEEQYLLGGLDGEAEFSWEEDQEERRPAPVKRALSPSTESCVDRQSRQSSASVSCTRAKRVRQVSPSETSTVVPSQLYIQDHEPHLSNLHPVERGVVEEQSDEGFYDFSQADNNYESSPTQNFCSGEAESQPRPSNPFIGHFEIINLKRETSLDRHQTYVPQPPQDPQHWLKYEHDPMQWTAPAPAPAPQPTDSFMSAQGVSMSGPDLNSQAAPSNFPGRQEFAFPQYPAPEMVQVNQVNQVAVPHFHAVSNASMFSLQSMAPIPLSSYMPAQQYDGHMHQEQTYTTTLPPDQFFMPAAEPAVTDYHPPMAASRQMYQEAPQSHPQFHHHQQPQQSQGQGHGFAQRHIVPMHYHGLPYTQANGWAHPQ